jgi:membrane protease YdiL (CAAX protease family)
MTWVSGDYWARARHPWSCVLFVVPLLLFYEVGLYCLGTSDAASLRNGADVWLRSGLAWAGLSTAYGAPVALILLLLAWNLFYREDRPRDSVGVWISMTMESTVLAFVLYGASRCLWPPLYALGGVLHDSTAPVPPLAIGLPACDLTAPSASEPAMVNLVRFVGAGIYEEALFRLGLFSALLAAFNLGEMPRRWSIGLAAVGSALLFAGAHNLGPRGEPFEGPLFVFRTLAGAYFAGVYCLRGFGVAVGAHAGYDVLVGLFVSPQGGALAL